MRELLTLAGYLAGWIVTARLLFVWQAREDDEADSFVPVVLGLIWPIVLGVTVALVPFAAVGWLISRPTRAERRARRAQR